MKRELDVGLTLSEVFSTYRDQAGTLLPVAFWLFLVVAIVDGIVGRNFALFPLVIVVSTIVGTLYQGMVVGLVRDVQDGRRDSSVGELFGFAAPVLLPLIGAGILYGLAVGVGLVLLIVPGLFLLTIWAVIAPVIVVERSGVFAAFGRSRELVRGNGWHVFWVIAVGFLISFAGAIVFGGIASALSNGPIVRIVFSALASTITAPIAALIAGILYYRLLAMGGPASTDPTTAADPAATTPLPADPPAPPPPPAE
jgi:hypothetical protein